MAQDSSRPSLIQNFESSSEALSTWFTKLTASSVGFAFALLLVIACLLLGFYVHFSALWQNVFSVGTAICTFLMVFLLQRAQSKDLLALHIKLNELIASQSGASNRV